ncbi:hypothetical protein DM02DRAFT_688471 [Periconia macrospinosa]|uniref:Uncharacterized protein n=1 Tax=Periconia macrospinosa TaxID=97972 RepID=A0A2V1DDH8_9PLEO|nr:hypothetical protein DM02DRAFT_688471 [Periconia macrospinosa]
MKFSKRPALPVSELLVELAQALGYADYPQSRDAEPHLNYIRQACTEKYTRKEYLRFIIHIIEHCAQNNPSTNSGPQSDTIENLLQNLEKDGYLQIFTDTDSDPAKRKVEVEDHVMGILGRWTMLLGHFQSRGGVRPLVTAYQKHAPQTTQVSAYAQNLASLSLSINSTSLNAFILSTDAAVDISWTLDLSRHMILTPENGRHTLEVFAMPCIFNTTHSTARTIGLPNNLATEIKYSYAMLFNAWPQIPSHAHRLRFLGIRKICWCWSCSAFRYRNNMLKAYEKWCNDKQRASKTAHGESLSLMDMSIVTLVKSKPLHEWNQTMFPHLWSRVARLHQHQLTAKPWSIWMLFRDRRDTLQYWTFLFAALVLIMTLLQVLLGIAQVVGSFT